jgi:hypothetical protein
MGWVDWAANPVAHSASQTFQRCFVKTYVMSRLGHHDTMELARLVTLVALIGPRTAGNSPRPLSDGPFVYRFTGVVAAC